MSRFYKFILSKHPRRFEMKSEKRRKNNIFMQFFCINIFLRVRVNKNL